MMSSELFDTRKPCSGVGGTPMADITDDVIAWEWYDDAGNVHLTHEEPPEIGATRITPLTAIQRQRERQAVPSGCKIVQIEPTDNMMDDGHEALDDRHHPGRFGECSGLNWGDAKACYQAMLAAAPSPEQGQAVPSGWITDSIPNVPVGDEQHCFIATRSKKTGKMYVYDAYYVNKPVPENEEDFDEYDVLYSDSGSPVSVVGWASLTAHPDFSGYYEMVTFDQTEFVGWMPMIYPAAPSPELISPHPIVEELTKE